MNIASKPIQANTTTNVRRSSIRKLWDFHGGVHPKFNKEMSNHLPIKTADIPKQLIVPLQQSMGQGAEPIVNIGDEVFKGQLIACQSGKLSANIHAPTSGKVTEISEQKIPHASGLKGLCIVIECDGKNDWGKHKLTPITDFKNTEAEKLLERIQACGIVGLGGAAFPTSLKVNTSAFHTSMHVDGNYRPNLKTLIINGAECEPYISCDDRLMQERSSEILQGIDILQQMLEPDDCIIAIEDNKPDAIKAFETLCIDRSNIEVVSIPTKYPSGGEKQLIEILTGLEVPSGGRPRDLGMLCLNPGTVYSIYNAIINGEPLISRIVTVTGNGISKPQNMEVLIGSSFSHLAEQAGGYTENADHLIMGGPMMGFALEDDNAPIVKATNCALFISTEELNESNSENPKQNQQQPTLPCIRCGKCMDVCPVKLLPQQLYWHIRAKDLDKAVKHNLRDCIDCGCCSYVCPSHIPLVDYYRFAKTELREQALATEKSNIARERFEFLQFRRERDKREREEKRAAHKAALQKKKEEAKKNANETQAEDPKKAAIKAAMERAKAKKLERLKQTQQADAEKAASKTDK